MVQSRINNNVTYKEFENIHSEDVGHESSVYILDAFGKELLVTIGKPKFEFIKKDILYYPIYLISEENKTLFCLGVFETKNNVNVFDEEGDLDITKLNPLFFDFVEKKIETVPLIDVEKYLSALNLNVTETNKEGKEGKDSNKGEGEKHEEGEEDGEDDDIMKIKNPSKSKQKSTESTNEPIFVEDPHFNPPPQLEEETEEIANSIRDTYRRSSSSSSKQNWIQKYMKNENYQIHEVSANGNCFFEVVVNAFAQIGKKTTVSKIRKILSEEITEDIYNEYKTLFQSLKSEIVRYDKEMQNIKTTFTQLKKRNETAKNKQDAEKIVQEGTKLKKTMEKLKSDKSETQRTIDSTVGDLSHIDSFEKFKEYIQTVHYWADAWAISTLEKKFNCKFIILNEESYKDDAPNSVLNCGEVNKNIGSEFKPDYYIITSYHVNHYRSVSYKNKLILTFSEIPYHIKAMIINKCFEKSAGVFYLIEDFRNLKKQLGIEPELGKPDDGEETSENELYDPSVVFVFHAKSEKTAKPGKGSGEKIPKNRMNEFIELSSIENWRRKLDDSWMETPFTVDGKRYASVEHYYQGAKFKNGHPDFAHLFSMDSESDISKDVNLCKVAGGKTGKMKSQIIRPKNIQIDPEFYPVRNGEERMKALKSKFNNNLDLKQLLKNTKNAQLCQYIIKNPPYTDVPLMQVRAEILEEE